MHMDITPYVEALRADLVTAADAGGEDSRAAAGRLALALDPAVRLALFDALSQAAAEITTALPGGSVEVRLRGREPDFVVEAPPPPAAAEDQPPDAEEAVDDDDTIARITLRLPESLKNRAEEAAGRRGQSLNTWLVNAVRNAARDRAVSPDLDLSSMPQGWPLPGHSRGPGKRLTGWAR
jgi:hypothetical protein